MTLAWVKTYIVLIGLVFRKSTQQLNGSIQKRKKSSCSSTYLLRNCAQVRSAHCAQTEIKLSPKLATSTTPNKHPRLYRPGCAELEKPSLIRRWIRDLECTQMRLLGYFIDDSWLASQWVGAVGTLSVCLSVTTRVRPIPIFLPIPDTDTFWLSRYRYRCRYRYCVAP